jgi:hypothetical protein
VYGYSGSETRRPSGATPSSGTRHNPGLHGQKTFALQLFAGELAGATDGFGLFPGFPLGGFFVVLSELHLAKDALTLHLLLQNPEGLVDIIVTDENLHEAFLFN